MEQGRVTVLVHCTLSHCQKHAYQVWNDLDLCSEQGNPDAADNNDDDAADAATADESNPYMSPFQATQKYVSVPTSKCFEIFGLTTKI